MTVLDLVAICLQLLGVWALAGLVMQVVRRRDIAAEKKRVEEYERARTKQIDQLYREAAVMAEMARIGLLPLKEEDK